MSLPGTTLELQGSESDLSLLMLESIIQISPLFCRLSIVSTCIPCMLQLDCQLLPCFLWVRPQWCINEKQHICKKEKHADELLTSVLQSAAKQLLHALPERSMESFSFHCWNSGISWQESQDRAVRCLPGPDPVVGWRCNGGYRGSPLSNAYMQRSLWPDYDAGRGGGSAGCWSS